MGGGGSLQRRVEELDALVKKLDEEKGNLKRDNVALVSSEISTYHSIITGFLTP